MSCLPRKKGDISLKSNSLLEYQSRFNQLHIFVIIQDIVILNTIIFIISELSQLQKRLNYLNIPDVEICYQDCYHIKFLAS